MNHSSSNFDYHLMMTIIDNLVRSDKFLPYKGWHGELPDPNMAAIQQDRGEFRNLLQIINEARVFYGSCLQLGMGPSGASHEVWRMIFKHVITIDLAVTAINETCNPGMNTHSHEAWVQAQDNGPFDFLFIDAGHSLADVSFDYGHYQLLVRSGGVIAFHDALDRPGFPEVKVHEFIKSLPVTVFGTEVGTAVMVKL